ncbi:universal stress protein [Furfurilactobacillus entadae]|uniref:universal stress protein n=1 Tax=Furfurilactobacillus entadae TaxID=2922307 RepID=UPI0035E82D39
MPFSPKHILVPTDGSENAELALRQAVDIAKLSDADISLLEVVAPLYPAAGMGVVATENFPENLVQIAKEDVKKLSQKISEETGFNKITTYVVTNSPKPTIARKFPEEHDVDLIVIGATGTNAFSRVVLGSTTGYVVRSAKVDVMVVKPQDG